MKKIPKIITIIAIIYVALTPFLSPKPVAAECRYLLGMPAWDCNIEKMESEDAEDNQKILISNAVIISSNVLTSLLIASSYLVVGFVIYGGYLYILSNGDSSKTAAGKKTIIHALIGLAVVMLSSIILGAIRIALGGKNLSENCIEENKCYNITDASSIVDSLLQWVIGVSGLVCAIFLVIGGIAYITSAGESSKITKAKETIRNALIGLAIVALAEVITAFASITIRNSAEIEPNSDTDATTMHEIIISKGAK